MVNLWGNYVLAWRKARLLSTMGSSIYDGNTFSGTFHAAGSLRVWELVERLKQRFAWQVQVNGIFLHRTGMERLDKCSVGQPAAALICVSWL